MNVMLSREQCFLSCIILKYIRGISSEQICSKVPIFYFNGPKCPSDNCYVTCSLREISVLSALDN